MSIKIIISPGVGGLQFSPEAVKQIFEVHPELFDDPLPVSELAFNDPVPDDLMLTFVNSMVSGDLFYSLNLGNATRTCPWLIEKLTNEGVESIIKSGYGAKVIEIPDRVEWYVHAREDGSEIVREKHRFWS